MRASPTAHAGEGASDGDEHLGLVRQTNVLALDADEVRREDDQACRPAAAPCSVRRYAIARVGSSV